MWEHGAYGVPVDPNLERDAPVFDHAYWELRRFALGSALNEGAQLTEGPAHRVEGFWVVIYVWPAVRIKEPCGPDT
jgi:hypothetical protein